MRRFGTYLFFLTLMVHTFSQVLIVGQFIVNQDLIAEELCENKDKPEMECNGKCYLKKELEKDEERKTDEKSPLKVEVLMVLDTKVVEVDSPIEFQIEQTETSDYTTGRLLSGFNMDVFHPPC